MCRCSFSFLLQEDEPARGVSERIQSRPGFGLGRFGWGLAKGAAKVTAATLCTVAIAALADKHTCHEAQKRHKVPQSILRNQVQPKIPFAGCQYCQTTE